MKELYLGFGLLSPQSAQQHLVVYGWIIDNFSKKHSRGEASLYPCSEADILKNHAPRNEPEHTQWIAETFRQLKNYCAMTSWPISFKPEPDELPKLYNKNKIQQNRLTEIYGTRLDEKYYVDDYGCPVFYYLPKMASRPGYLKRRIFKKLADMLHKTGRKPIYVQRMDNHQVMALCAAFLGFGHIICAGQDIKKTPFRLHGPDNHTVFSLALYFKSNGLKMSQIRRLHGHLLSKETLRDLKSAYWQLGFFKGEVKILQEKLEEHSRPSHLLAA